MGPKKAGKGGAAIELDTAVFSREGDDYAKVEGEVAELEQLLSCNLSVVAGLFPEWDIEGENWAAEIPEEEVPRTAFPSYISTNGENVALKVHLGLEADVPVDPKAKGKKDAKKGAPASGELTEPEADEEGNPLPRMFIPAKKLKSKYDWNFNRKWEPHQETLNAKLATLKAAVAEATQKVAEAPEDEEAKGVLTAAEGEEAQFMDQNGLIIAAPSGDYVDPCLVAALRLVFTFGPAVTRAKGGSFEALEGSAAAFPEGVRCLWENIYPKLPDGRPMYNPSGRYAVRLFLGGAWRMIKVNDHVPVTADKKASLQGSEEPLELWPMVLSKALYTAFTACGYMNTMKDILPTEAVAGADGEPDTPGVSVEDALRSRRVSTYASFVVHMLTSWLPSSPWSVSGLLQRNPAMLATLLERAVAGGAPLVRRSEIPSNTILVQDEEEGSVRSMATGADGQPVMKTKRQFKELYAKAKAEKEHMLSIIGCRENAIEALDNAVNSIAQEPFSLCYLDSEGKPVVVPILAVSYPEVEAAAPRDNGLVMVLVEWTREEAVVVRVEGANIAAQTPVKMGWVTLNSLMSKNAHIVSFDSCVQTKNSALLAANWAAAVAADDGGKGKKGKGAEPVADPKLTENGTMAPTLLQIARTAPPVAEEGAAPAPEGGEEAAPAPVAEAGAEEGDVPAPAADTEVPAAADPAQSGTIRLTVTIHADLPKPAAEGDGEAAATTEEGAAAPPASLGPGLNDGVVLVLTEVRFDDQAPLVLRMEMDKAADLPLARTTFEVPRAGLYGVADKPVLFWVALYTRASVQVSFNSDMVVSVGKAEEIWTDLGMCAKVHEGESAPTPAGTEQQFCEVTVTVVKPEDDPKEDLSHRTPALCAFHVPSTAMSPNVSLVHAIAHYDHKAAVDDSRVLPRLSPNLLTLSEPGSGSRIIGRVCDLRAGSDRVLPAFKWKVVMLVERPIETESREIGAEKKRFEGLYAPNRELTVFNDVISIDKTSFPFSFRLNLDGLPVAPAPVEGEEANPAPDAASAEDSAALLQTLKGTVMTVTLRRKSDNKVIHKYTGRKLISAYAIPILGFLEDGEEPPAAGAADPKGKGKGGKDAGGAGCEISITCVVDATRTVVPDEWRSMLPHAFYSKSGPVPTIPAADAGSEESKGEVPLHDVPPVEPKFKWTLDILVGNATAMAHDFRGLEKAVEEKNSWGATDDTRAERAVAATAYFTNKLRARQLLQEGADLKTDVFDHLTKAIKEELPRSKVLESIVTEPTGFRETVSGPKAVAPPYNPDNALSESASVEKLEHWEIGPGTHAKVISDPYKDRGQRLRDLVAVDKQNEAAFNAYTAFKEGKREQKAARVEALLQQAEGIDKLFLWDEREKERQFTEERNKSLASLLEKSTQARSDAKDLEEGKAPGGKKKK
jgi:hypothetical protein